MKITSAQATIGKLREVFAKHGVPRAIVSDNGRRFICEKFRNFCTSNAAHHVTGMPYYPKTTGLAGRVVRTLKERMLAAKNTSPALNLRLQKLLMSHRDTPQKSTGRLPAELLFGHRLRTCLDLLKPDVRAIMDAANYRQQSDHDEYSRPRAFAKADPVWILNTTSTEYQPGEVHRWASVIRGSAERKIVRKHADQLRFRRVADKIGHAVIDSDSAADTDIDSVP